MHKVSDIEDCFALLSKEENLEWVDCIPSIPKSNYIKCWKLITEILIGDSVAEIELWIGFDKHFPYILPDFYFLETKYDFFPHINHSTRKLCYIEDGASYDINKSSDILRNCIHRAKRLIEDGVNKVNVEDFVSEINSYWFDKYGQEPMPLYDLIMYGVYPSKSSWMDLYSYREGMTKSSNKQRNVLIQQEDKSAFYEYISSISNVEKHLALYLKSLEIKRQPPYSISFKQLINSIHDNNDLKLLKSCLNRNRSLVIVFELFNSNRFGGIIIPTQPKRRKGFRNVLTAFDELIKFEKQNEPLKRIIGEVYSKEVKMKRDFSVSTNRLNFTVVGLGSIGSNLCYYLMGYSDCEFTLIDDDILRSENTGRHLLGFRHIGQPKSFAIRDYMKEKNPEITIRAYTERIQDNFEERINEINKSSALFVCVGDAMTEEFLIDNVHKGIITTPLFILWLEPFSIAGHMLYVNPQRIEKEICITEGDLKLYKHNLIHPDMYKNRSDEFVEHDAGCNGAYAKYNQNCVTLFLSSLYPIVDELLQRPNLSKCYRWIGNIDIANQRNIILKDSSIRKGSVSELPL